MEVTDSDYYAIFVDENEIARWDCEGELLASFREQLKIAAEERYPQATIHFTSADKVSYIVAENNYERLVGSGDDVEYAHTRWLPYSMYENAFDDA